MGISGNIFFVHNSDRIARNSVTLNQVCTTASRIVPKIIIVVTGATFFLLLVSPVTSLDWTTETVDSPGDVGWYTSLALDNSDNPRISYMDWTNRYLKFAAKVNGVWINETVDTTNSVGEFTSLKIDLSGQPFISYFDGSGDLLFAMKTGNSWTKVVVDSGSVGRYTSLALDSSGDPRISYQDWGNRKLKYAAKSGGTWTNETVDNSGNVGAYSSMALDGSGNPHISYYDGAKGDLKYAVKSGGLWTNQTIDSSGNIGYYTSIALEGSGNPHISYYDGVSKNLKYATKTGSSWIKEIVDSNDSVGKYTSLALDSSGNPHISYYDETYGHLKYAVKNGDVWTNSTVDNAPNVGMFTSLALDNAGNPRISYRDFENNDLKYAISIPPSLLNFTASSLNGPAPLTVQFSDTSTGGSPSFWNWSFGDGVWFNTSITALRNPSHVYETPGTYTVNLTIQNFSVASTLSRSGYVTVIAPPETTVPTTSPTPAPTPTVTPAPTIISLPTPTLTSPITPTPAPFKGSGSTDEPLSAPSSTPVPPAGGPLGCQTVNVGGDSAISRVTVIGQDITDIIVTARKLTALPSGVTPVDMPVYQYINVTPARYKLISAALIEFEVPLFSIVDHHASENNVWLCVLMNRTWVNLPTYTSGSKDGKVHYHAESPEFSLFAITIRNEKSIESPESVLMVSTVSGKRTGFESQESNISAIPKNPVKIAQGSSNTGFSFLFIIISIMGMIGIVIGVVLIRSGWVHR